MLIRGRDYRSTELVDVLIDDRIIVSISPPRPENRPDREADWIAPAYFDLQINGAGGVNFTSPCLTDEQVCQVIASCRHHGIAAFCPTVITASREVMVHSLSSLCRAADSTSSPLFHLEGPYICVEDGPRGAHPRHHIRPPDWDEFLRFQDAAGGRIGLVTLAPELPGAISFIERLASTGVVPAIGHSAGPSSAILDAVRAGARLSTHLGNGCHRHLPRHDNILWEQLACDHLFASIITDGHHLPWPLIQNILRCKTPNRLILTCDASPLAGQPEGRYTPWGDPVDVLPGGKIVLADHGLLAGSWHFTDHCVESFAAHFPELPFSQVHSLAADQPRSLLGLPVQSMAPGQPANLLLYQQSASGPLRLAHSYIAGRWYDGPSTSRPPVAAAH
jgi:N-acetylglucosamine-6-phosphate deacetylase